MSETKEMPEDVYLEPMQTTNLGYVFVSSRNPKGFKYSLDLEGRIEALQSEIDSLKRGEYICTKCFLRKCDEKIKARTF